MAFALAIVAAMLGAANARNAKHSHPVAPPPPPSIGYFGYFPIELDYAQAQAWSLSRPYYTHFMYNYCDYRNCVLRRNDKGELAPVWFGPVN
jgi:hypothetical protein